MGKSLENRTKVAKQKRDAPWGIALPGEGLKRPPERRLYETEEQFPDDARTLKKLISKNEGKSVAVLEGKCFRILESALMRSGRVVAGGAGR